MQKAKIVEILIKNYAFTNECIDKLSIFHDFLLNYNSKYNLISKSTEKDIWQRHFLDSAQILAFIGNKSLKISDFGTGAGFPGLIIAIFGQKYKFHVKLYEKSPVKREFLEKLRDKIKIKFTIHPNVYTDRIISDIIVCRAFKKLNEIFRISREIIERPHQIIILKGKNAQNEINKVSLAKDYSYKLINSITNNESKIIIVNAK
tara:strand:+ start:507 stop:1118 length:612 start_codon:yes stop_codon:yes gene_type:complete